MASRGNLRDMMQSSTSRRGDSNAMRLSSGSGVVNRKDLMRTKQKATISLNTPETNLRKQFAGRLNVSSGDDSSSSDSSEGMAAYVKQKSGRIDPSKLAEDYNSPLAFIKKSRRKSELQSTLHSQHTNMSTNAIVGVKEKNVYEYIPEEFLHDPKTAEPMLHFLPKLINRVALEDDDPEPIPLNDLLTAAEEDVRLHRARIKAGIERDQRLLRSYQLEMDPGYQDRQARLAELAMTIKNLNKDADTILKDLEESSDVRGLTQAERTQVQLHRWQRALELYVYTHHEKLDWQKLFEKLLDGVSEDQDISQILSEASDMCAAQVNAAKQSVRDAAANVMDIESAYIIRLEAHQVFARENLIQVAEIEEQFKSSGRAALQIGHQLEHAELKRSQCEAASILIRRWWILESLAEQEAASGQPIDVKAEISGKVPLTSCKMDPLFTRPENSIEAAKALKSLRAVVRSRGNAASAGGAPGTGIRDKSSSKRFDLTANLINRTNDALEQRLLTSFSDIYTTGGFYDFSAKARPGSVDWRELRSLAEALLLFDSGRTLLKTYVDLVVTTRFPELFQEDTKTKSKSDFTGEDFDIDETRSKLSSLFHRVSDVCSAEFELIAHVFGSEGSRTDLLERSEEMSLVVARSLLQRVVSDPKNGLQARINELLASVDHDGDFEAGAKKLDTFVVIHEKAAGLFGLLRDAAERMIPTPDDKNDPLQAQRELAAAQSAVETLKGFLTSQELSLSNAHRQSYMNLELRLLHHDCCGSLDLAGCTMVKGPPPRPTSLLIERGILEEYRAPVLPLHKESLARSGFTGILSGALKQSVLRQPLIHATDSLSRARLMFGTSKRGGETTSRVILSIYSQMCSFYGEGFLYPIMETLREMLPTSAPSLAPQLPFDEELEAPDLGVSPAFWVALERVHSAAKSFDRELWAENRPDSHRVWDTLESCGDTASQAIARAERAHFYAKLEQRGEAAILQALDALSAHIQWVLVTGGESMLATGGTRILSQLTGSSGGPYAIPAGASLETPNSPAVKSLTYCLRVQFVHVQAALTPQSLASFWTALSMRLYDILVARLLQHYSVSTVGAVILSRDVEALRSVAMLAGTDHGHWDVLRELLTLYMTPPDAIKGLLTGPEGDVTKGLFAKAGRDQALVFLSRRNDYRYKTASGPKKSGWVTEMLSDLNLQDPTDGQVNIGLFAAGRKN